MTDRPILRISLDDSELVAFQRKWTKYQEKLAEVAPAWAEVAELHGSTADKFDQMRVAGGLVNSISKEVVTTIHSTAISFSLINDAWTYIYRGGRKFREHIQESTQHLRRWERMTGVFAALVGAGGLYGIGRMAAGATARGREAAGLGTDFGGLSAAQVNWGRLGNVEGMIHGFNQNLLDPRLPALHALGLDSVRGMNATDAMAASLPKIKKLLDNTDPRNLANVVRGYGLDTLGIDTQTARLIQRLPESEIDDIIAAQQRNKNPFGLDKTTLEKWAEFTTQMERAGVGIKNALVIGLVPLAGPLGDLSASVVHAVGVLVSTQGDRANRLLTRIGSAFEGFGNWLGSGGVQTALSDFEGKFDLTKKQFDDLNNWFGSHGELLKWLGGAALAFRLGGAAGVAAYALGTTLMPQPLNPDEDERRRQQQYGQVRRTGGSDLVGMRHEAQQRAEQEAIRRSTSPGTLSQKMPHVLDSTGGGAVGTLSPAAGRHPNIAGTDPELQSVMAEAQRALPPGYKMVVNEGYNPSGHVLLSQHHRLGHAAMDVAIIGPDGKVIPNRGDDPTGMYHRLARAAYGDVLKHHPDLKGRFAWGGAFGTVTGGNTQDLMHFDVGGERGHITENLPSRMGPIYTKPTISAHKRTIFGHPHLAGRKPQDVRIQDDTGGDVGIHTRGYATGGGF